MSAATQAIKIEYVLWNICSAIELSKQSFNSGMLVIFFFFSIV